MKKTVNLTIPFCGFDESVADSNIDPARDYDIENYNEEWIPADIRGDESARYIADLLYDNYDYKTAQRLYVIKYVEALQDALNSKVSLQFEAMVSPKEYNFTTDRIFCDMPLSDMKKIMKDHKKDKFRTLKATIEANHTSRDGFVSFYRPELSLWTERPLDQLDHNELGTVFEAWLTLQDIDDNRLFEINAYMDDCYNIVDNCRDWKTIESKVADYIEEKRAELGPDYVPPIPRCTKTMDLFNV